MCLLPQQGPLNRLWWVLEKKGVSLKNIKLIKDMYDIAVIRVRIVETLQVSFLSL